MDAPSPNGHDGRDALGRFAPGHKGGPGNPSAKRSAAIRTAFLKAISAEDIQAIARKLIEKAKAGDLVASKLILMWAIGRPADPVFPDAIAAMLAAEAQVSEPLPLPVDHEARLDLVARQLAQDMRRERRGGPDAGTTVSSVETVLEDLDAPF